jgi:hypothetical protein
MNKFHPVTTILIIIFSIYFLCGCSSTKPTYTDQELAYLKYRYGIEFPPEPKPLRGLTREQFLYGDGPRRIPVITQRGRFFRWRVFSPVREDRVTILLK